MSNVHYSSETVEWGTPQEFFDKYDAIYHFDLDVCASKGNAKCKRYYTAKQDGLAQEWTGTCWMNPPYGRGITAWLKKAYETSRAGHTVVCLIPSRTDTKWWHEYVMRGKIEFIRGRLQFDGMKEKDNAPFPNAVVIFKGRKQ